MSDSADLLKLQLKREIAARKIAEHLLEQKSTELEASNHELLAQIAQVSRLSVAIDTAGEGIAMTDRNGVYTYMNTAHAQMFGFDRPQDLIGQSWACLYDNDALAHFDQEVMPQFARDGRWNGEVTGRSVDGTLVFQDLILTQLEDGGILCSTRDIGQRRIREKETADLRRRVIEADRAAALDQLVETVTHDFSNFLGAIDAAATLLEKQCNQPEPHRLLMSVFDALRQARSVLNQLLPNYAAPAEKVCDVTDLVPRLCEVMTPLLDIAQTSYCKVPEAPLFVAADPTLFARSMTNIFKNAIEAMTVSGSVLRIEVQSLSGYVPPTLPFDPAARLIYGSDIDETMARIIVHDEGEGMPQTVLDHALERFVSTKCGGRRRGIGLTSVKDLVETTGGRVAIFSAAGVGSVFVLDLPAHGVEHGRADGEEATRLAEDTVGNVLLVDDDPIALGRLEVLFQARGWGVVSFSSPGEALDFLVRVPNFVQLLVTDRSMPTMSGDQLAQRVKAVRPDLPIVLCSNALGSAISADIDATLAKPPSDGRLQAILVRLNLTR
ncbi:ATP-binding protein [Sphingomonas sp. UYEF23]|uniref:ATP-binding protein n=1 Tax=Sphingomonas sp. UYEF23 TaxID=1756408 RepID=UPI00339647B8